MCGRLDTSHLTWADTHEVEFGEDRLSALQAIAKDGSRPSADGSNALSVPEGTEGEGCAASLGST